MHKGVVERRAEATHPETDLGYLAASTPYYQPEQQTCRPAAAAEAAMEAACGSTRHLLCLHVVHFSCAEACSPQYPAYVFPCPLLHPPTHPTPHPHPTPLTPALRPPNAVKFVDELLASFDDNPAHVPMPLLLPPPPPTKNSSQLSPLQAVKFIDELLSIKTDKLGQDVLLAAAKTSMGSKVVGAEGDFFAQMVVEAIQAVQTTDQVGRGANTGGTDNRPGGDTSCTDNQLEGGGVQAAERKQNPGERYRWYRQYTRCVCVLGGGGRGQYRWADK